MGKSLDSIQCPICETPGLILDKYESGLGYRLTCKCDGLRVRVYLDNFAKATGDPFAEKVTPIESPRKSRAKELLERAAALVGEEKKAA